MTILCKLTDRFSETTVDDEVVVMDLLSGDFFSLKDTAKAIWGQIDGVHSREAIIAALAHDFGIMPAQIASDVDDFLACLREAGFVARN